MENLPQEQLDQINGVLDGLDPFDDNVWTTQGDPRMEVIQAKLGDETITRKHLKQANALFSREFLLKNQVKEANTPKPPADEANAEPVKEEPLVISGHTTPAELQVMFATASINQIAQVMASLQSRKENIETQKLELSNKLQNTQNCINFSSAIIQARTPKPSLSQTIREVLDTNREKEVQEQNKKDALMKSLGVSDETTKSFVASIQQAKTSPHAKPRGGFGRPKRAYK